MATEETRSSQRRRRTDPAGPVTELARQVASAIAEANPDGDPPEIRVRGAAAEPGAEALPISGSVDIEIVFREVTYKLTGTLPGSNDEDEYSFTLTMQKKDQEDPTELLGFTFVDKDDWSVTVSVPEWKVTDTFTINLISVTVTKEPPTSPIAAVADSADAVPS